MTKAAENDVPRSKSLTVRRGSRNSVWRRSRLDHIPGSDGWPIIGHTFTYLRNQEGYSRTMVERYGPVYRSNAFLQRSVSTVSPDAVQLLLRDPEKIFSSKLGWHHLIGRFFKRGLMLRDFDDHRMHRRIMQKAFTKSALKSYLTLMNPVIEEGVAAWGKTPKMRFYPEVKQLTLNLAGVVFAGLPLGPRLQRVNRAFIDLMWGSFALVRWPLPGGRYWKALRGRKFLVSLFEELIPEKRKGQQTDMLAQLCRAESDEGERLDDEEIVDHMVFLMLAAHDTTTSALTNLVWALGTHPEWQDRLRSQFLAIDKTNLDHADLDSLSDVDLVLKETLRLFPPVTGIPRMTKKECTIEGVRIPEKTVIWLLPTVTQRLEKYWSNPNSFDPERFSDERAEHKQHPGLWYPYSSGAHICLGMTFSVVQAKAVLNQLLRRYKITLPKGYQPKRQLIPFPKPVDDLPITLTPL